MGSLQQAPYWRRLCARLIDALIVVVAWILARPLFALILKGPILLLLRIFGSEGEGGTALMYILISVTTLLLAFLFVLALYSAVNIFTLMRSGQTLGKKLLGIQIVDMNGKVPSVHATLVKRDLSFFAVIPVTFFVQFFYAAPLNHSLIFLSLFYIVDVMFIFSNDRRCLHDRYAETQVCKLQTDI